MVEKTKFFQQEADQLIRELADSIDEKLGHIMDADLEAEILTITLQDKRQFIVNRNDYHGQIWLSSPISGAWHFSWDEQTSLWRSTRYKDISLKTLLEKELAEISKKPVAL